MTLNGEMAVTLRYFTECGKPALQKKRSVVEFMQESIVFLVRVQCRRKESSRPLSHLSMSFLLKVQWQHCWSRACNDHTQPHAIRRVQ